MCPRPAPGRQGEAPPGRCAAGLRFPREPDGCAVWSPLCVPCRGAFFRRVGGPAGSAHGSKSANGMRPKVRGPVGALGRICGFGGLTPNNHNNVPRETPPSSPLIPDVSSYGSAPPLCTSRPGYINEDTLAFLTYTFSQGSSAVDNTREKTFNIFFFEFFVKAVNFHKSFFCNCICSCLAEALLL